jgi:hypothetical protein
VVRVAEGRGVNDWPAAHSMDTTWFAVDRCGHVGIFESGEEGAVADGAPDAYEIFDEPFRPGELRWALDRSKHFVWGAHGTKITEYTVGRTGEKHRFVSGFLILAPALEFWSKQPERRGEGRLSIGRTDGHLWMNGQITIPDWTWLHEAANRCLGCGADESLSIEDRCALYGIFEYECPAYGHPPYERGAPPSLPATLAMLRTLFKIPEKLPAFPFCFHDKPRLQPKEHVPSHLYGDEWVKEDGTPMTEAT